MRKSTVIGMGAYTKQLRKELTDYYVGVQTANLINYAQDEIKKLGDMIQTYHSANHMDRTGNLLNSLCWIVTYGESMKTSGFYRNPKTNFSYNRWGQERGMGMRGGSSSFLHEFFDPTGEEVVGVQMAMDFIESFKGSPNKWKVAFAILAPYWGYWESGFTMRGGGGEEANRVTPRFSRFMQFQVMTHIFDDVRMEMKPADTHFTVYVPSYSYRGRSAKGKKYKNRIGAKKYGVIE